VGVPGKLRRLPSSLRPIIGGDHSIYRLLILLQLNSAEDCCSRRRLVKVQRSDAPTSISGSRHTCTG
jgi:hypothetical protein